MKGKWDFLGVGPYYPMFETQFKHTNDKSPAVADIQLDIQLK